MKFYPKNKYSYLSLLLIFTFLIIGICIIASYNIQSGVLSTEASEFDNLYETQMVFSENSEPTLIIKQGGIKRVGKSWDLSYAKAIAVQHLQFHGGLEEFDHQFFKDMYQTDLMFHRFISHYKLRVDGTTRHILFYYSKPNLEQYNCRACPVNLSVFEFEKRAGDWGLMFKSINFDTAGEWGRPPENVSIEKIGEKISVIQITARYTNMDSWYGIKMELFMKNNGSYITVFDTWLETSAPFNISDWENRRHVKRVFTIIRSTGREYFDILLTATEVENEWIKSGDSQVSCKFLYRFNSKVYQLIEGELPREGSWLEDYPCTWKKHKEASEQFSGLLSTTSHRS